MGSKCAYVVLAIHYVVNPRLREMYMGCKRRDKDRTCSFGSEPRNDVRSKEKGKDENIHPGEPPRRVPDRGKHTFPVRVPCAVIPRSVIELG